MYNFFSLSLSLSITHQNIVKCPLHKPDMTFFLKNLHEYKLFTATTLRNKLIYKSHICAPYWDILVWECKWLVGCCSYVDRNKVQQSDLSPQALLKLKCFPHTGGKATTYQLRVCMKFNTMIMLLAKTHVNALNTEPCNNCRYM